MVHVVHILFLLGSSGTSRPEEVVFETGIWLSRCHTGKPFSGEAVRGGDCTLQEGEEVGGRELGKSGVRWGLGGRQGRSCGPCWP